MFIKFLEYLALLGWSLAFCAWRAWNAAERENELLKRAVSASTETFKEATRALKTYTTGY